MTLILWCVLAAGVMHIFCAGIAKAGRRDYNNRDPRAWLESLEGYRARANAAQKNTLEAQPFFMAAILLALHNNASLPTLQTLAVLWLALRVAYIGLYLADRATLRSLVWLAALAVNIAILFLKSH